MPLYQRTRRPGDPPPARAHALTSTAASDYEGRSVANEYSTEPRDFVLQSLLVTEELLPAIAEPENVTNGLLTFPEDLHDLNDREGIFRVPDPQMDERARRRRRRAVNRRARQALAFAEDRASDIRGAHLERANASYEGSLEILMEMDGANGSADITSGDWNGLLATPEHQSEREWGVGESTQRLYDRRPGLVFGVHNERDDDRVDSEPFFFNQAAAEASTRRANRMRPGLRRITEAEWRSFSPPSPARDAAPLEERAHAETTMAPAENAQAETTTAPAENAQAESNMMPADAFYADSMWPDREIRNRRQRWQRQMEADIAFQQQSRLPSASEHEVNGTGSNSEPSSNPPE